MKLILALLSLLVFATGCSGGSDGKKPTLVYEAPSPTPGPVPKKDVATPEDEGSKAPVLSVHEIDNEHFLLSLSDQEYFVVRYRYKVHLKRGFPTSANLGFITGHGKSSWKENCESAQKIPVMQILEEKAAKASGDSDRAESYRKRIIDSLKLGHLDAGAWGMKIDFESDAEARNLARGHLPEYELQFVMALAPNQPLLQRWNVKYNDLAVSKYSDRELQMGLLWPVFNPNLFQLCDLFRGQVDLTLDPTEGVPTIGFDIVE